jgi:hypothetical protein
MRALYTFGQRACVLALIYACAGCNAVPVKQGEPVNVTQCLQGETPDVAAWPLFWWLDGAAWAISTLGIVEQERTLRTAEHACVRGLKEQGAVR